MANEELYSYDRYFGHDIFIVEDNNFFFGGIYENGICFKDNVKSLSPEGCLSKCKAWVDKEEDKDG